MGTYFPKGASGRQYGFQIQGDLPTEYERQWAEQYITSLGDRLLPDANLIEDDSQSNALVRGFSRGVDTLQLGLGSALEGAGEVTGVDWLKDFGEGVVETNKQQLAEAEEYATRLDDVQDIGSGLSFFGETLGEQAPQLGSTLGGSAAGAVVGSAIVPGVGTVIGGVVGGLAANLPFFYGMNREAQKEEGGEVDEGIAALTAIPQAALDYIADRIVVGRLLNPKLINGGGLISRGVKGVGVGATFEAPTEVGQEILQRMQAGQDITSDEAIKTYIEVAVAAGLVGGTVRGTTNVIGGDPNKKEAAKAKEELEEDLSLQQHETMKGAAQGLNAATERAEDPSVKEEIVQERLNTEQSQQKQQQEAQKINSGTKPVALDTLSEEDQQNVRLNRQGLGAEQTDTVTVAELRDYGMQSLAETIQREQLGAAQAQATDKGATKTPFTQEQYDSAVEAVRKAGKADLGTVADAIKGKGGKRNNGLAQAILDEMTANRVVKTVDGSKFDVLTEDEVKVDPATPLRRRLDTAKKKLESARKQQDDAKNTEKVILDGWENTPKQNRDLKKAKDLQQKAQANARRAEAEVRDVQRQVDVIDSRTGAAGQLNKQTTTTEQANLALKAAREAEKAEFRANHNANSKKIKAALRKYLTALGLKDVALKADALLEPELFAQGAIVEGYYGHAKKIIALALDIYDPSLTQAEQLQKLKAVMNHEVIHALRDMGLFTDAEYKTLVDAARKRKFTINKDGENVERKYTFIDRALRMNAQQENETAEQYQARVEEEAVAEMFRAYADGRLKVAGKPLSLFKRIVNFFKGIKQAYAETGFERADQVFEDILSGKVGARERGVTAGRVQQRVMPTPVDPNADEEAQSYSYVRIFPQNLSKFNGSILTREEAMEVQNFPEKVIGNFLGVNKSETDSDIKEGTQATIRLNLNGRTFLGPDAEAYKTDYNRMSSMIARMNIPAHEKDALKGRIPKDLNEKYPGTISTAIQTAHQGSNPNNKALAYDTAFTVKNATFPVNQNARAKISTGLDNKFPMAGVTGNVTHGANRTEGLEVKFNPFKHHVFVASFPMEDGTVVEVPIKSAEEATVYGNTVYVRGKLEFYDELDTDFPQVVLEIEGKDKKTQEAVTRTPPPVQYSFEIPEQFDGDMKSYSTINLDPARVKKTSEVTKRIKSASGLNYPQKLFALSMLHRLDVNDNFIEVSAENTKGKPVKMGKEMALQILQDERGDLKLDPSKSEDLRTIAKLMAIEAEAALRRDGNAIGWYEAKLQAAKEVLHAMQAAEGKNRTVLTDPDMEAAFDYALAITSNGVAVTENFGYAIRQLDHWDETGEFIEQGYGKRIEAMTKAFRLFNSLQRGDAGTPMSAFEIAEYLEQKTTISELKKNELFKDLGMSVPSGERAGLEVPLAYMLGPKIGAGFFMNLRGDFSQLTMDMWWMRMWNRLIGSPFKQFSPELKAKNIGEFKEALINIEDDNVATDFDRKLYQEVLDDLDIEPNSDDNIVAIALEFDRRWQRHFTDVGNKNTALVKAYAEQNGLNWKDQSTKDATPNQTPRPEKKEIAAASGRVTEKFLKPVEQDSPRGAIERQQMRDAAEMAREILSDQLGIDINMADFQALMWYPEKQLLASMNISTGMGADNDYVDGAIAVAKERGMADADIEEALPDSERGRLAPVQRVQDGTTSGRDGEGIPSTAEEVEGRLLQGASQARKNEAQERSSIELSYEQVPFTENLSDEFQDAVDSTSDVINGLPINDRSYSLIGKPLAKHYNPIAQRKQAKGDDLPKNPFLFGVTRGLGGKPYPIYLLDGQHVEEGTSPDERPVKGVGSFGLAHIMERNHHNEITENSKWPSVQQAIYDMLYVWKGQDAKDGAEVKVYADGGAGNMDQRLEYYPQTGKNPPLVMSLKYVRGQGGQDFYVVRTVYPDLRVDRKSRSVIDMGRMPIDTNFRQPINEAVAGVERNYDKITYNNVAKVLGNFFSKVPGLSKETAERIESNSERFLTKFQDAMLPVGKLMDDLRKKGMNIADGMDVYMREELSHGFIGSKLEKNQENLFEPLAQTIAGLDVPPSILDQLSRVSKYYRESSKVADTKLTLVETYLYALHAKERNQYVEDKFGRGLGSGMSDQEADAIIAWFETLGADNMAKVTKAQRIVADIIASTNNERREGGLMAEEYEFNNYVPLRGILDPDSEIEEDRDNFPRKTRPSQQNLFGGKRKQDPSITDGRGNQYATDIIANVMAQNQRTIIDAERNKVGQSFLNLIQADDMDMSGIGEVVSQVTPRIAENVLNVKVNGRQEPVRIYIHDDRIARAMKGAYADAGQGANGLVKVMRQFNRMLSNINTTYNPEFVITNFARDLETAGINIGQYDEKGLTKEILKGALPAVRGIAASIGAKGLKGKETEWSAIFKDFVEAGGKNSTNQIDDIQDQIKNVESILNQVSSQPNKLGAVKNGFNGILKFLDDYNTAVENGVRVATYKALLDRGFSKDRAAQAARNVTVNFAKGGEDKFFMNALYLFYNASIQGSFALLNAATRSKTVRKLWGGLIVYGILQDQLNAALAEDEDEDGRSDYDELLDYHLEHNIILPTLGLSDEKFIKIPLGYGLHAAVNFGRVLSRSTRGEYKAGEAFNSGFGTFIEALSPFGGITDFDELGDYANLVAPTVADPFLSLLANRDYDGTPIYKENSPYGVQKPDSQLYWNSTPATFQTISRVLNQAGGGSDITPGGVLDISPDVLDFWFSYLTGGAGKFVQRTLETPQNINAALEEDFDGDLVREIPFVRKLFIGPSQREDTGAFIEGRDDVMRAFEELEFAIQSRDQARVQEVRQEYRKELAVYGRLKALNNYRNKLMRQRNKVKSAPNMPESQKKVLIKNLNERIVGIVRDANNLMSDL